MLKLATIGLSFLAGLLMLTACDSGMEVSNPFAGEKATVTLSYFGEEIPVDVESSGNQHCEAGVAKMRALDYEGAKNELQTAVAENDKDHAAHFALGVACEKTGDIAAARKHYQRAVELKGKDTYMAALLRADDQLKK